MTETYSDERGGDPGYKRNPLEAHSTSAPPQVTDVSGSTTNTPKTPSIIPLAPGGTKFRRVMAWLGLSLPAWLVALAVASPVSLRCTSVSVPAEYDRGFAQVALVCWAVFRAPGATTNAPSDGLTPKSDPQSSGSWGTDTVAPFAASWTWTEVVGVGE
jgi:hypothetical protein